MTPYEEKGFLIEQLREESKKFRTLQYSLFNSIYFHPKTGKFTYRDIVCSHEAVTQLIEDGFIYYFCLSEYEGEMIPRYMLNVYRCK